MAYHRQRSTRFSCLQARTLRRLAPPPCALTNSALASAEAVQHAALLLVGEDLALHEVEARAAHDAAVEAEPAHLQPPSFAFQGCVAQWLVWNA